MNENSFCRESEDNYEGSGAGCSDKAYIQTQTKFQACSHTVSKDVYQQFQGVEGINLVAASLLYNTGRVGLNEKLKIK